jgi:hypothetical protein
MSRVITGDDGSVEGYDLETAEVRPVRKSELGETERGDTAEDHTRHFL